MERERLGKIRVQNRLPRVGGHGSDDQEKGDDADDHVKSPGGIVAPIDKGI